MNKKILFFLLPLLCFLLAAPEEAASASANGVNLWFHTVLPTLLPFIILSDLLISGGASFSLPERADRICRLLTGFSSAGCYILALGFFCGFPMGANLSASFFRSGRISEGEARRLLCLSNQVSPLFLQGYIAALLPDAGLLPAILGIYYGTALLLLFLSRLRPISRESAFCVLHAQKKEASLSLGERMDASIMNGFEIITRLGGYIILFSVCGALLQTLTAQIPLLPPVLSLFLEISSGSSLLLQSHLAHSLGLALLTAGLSFGGISTVIQTASVIRGSGLPLRIYVGAKLLQACTAFFLTLLFFAVV